MEEKEERISDLEGSLSQLKKEAEDMTQLLEGVQNDKTALSRALTQNKDLKQQLVELQNGFVKMVGSCHGSLMKSDREEILCKCTNPTSGLCEWVDQCGRDLLYQGSLKICLCGKSVHKYINSAVRLCINCTGEAKIYV